MANKEIQVGEYYRTQKGKIHKWTKGRTYIGQDKIVNHDFNIIKLIQVGDYVNGFLVEAIDCEQDENGNLFDVLGIFFRGYDCEYSSEELKNINIYSIVTKEQFKSMSYKVGGEDEY